MKHALEKHDIEALIIQAENQSQGLTGLGPADVVARSIDVRNQFKSLYGESCRLYRAPGRVNLIGEHTDYNDGFVMPAAINFYCWVAISSANSRKVEVYSGNLKESRTFDLDRPQSLGDWSDYVQGVAIMLERSGHHLQGAKMLISSEVPIGSGLSSSAALEVASGLALLDAPNARGNGNQFALACQRAENEFVGARCGIMDQFVACNGKAGHLLLLDCRLLEHRLLRVPADLRLVICNSMVRHALAAGEYNVRRSQCEEGVRLLSRARPGISALRDLTLEDFEQLRELLPPEIRKRCRHVISENQRVIAAATVLEHCDLKTEQRDLKSFGELMAKSHESLRHDYAVSCPELDLLVDLANQMDGVYGARMTGGGFGGCTINAVAADAAPEFQKRIASKYHEQTGIVPEIYISTASDGAGRWEAST